MLHACCMQFRATASVQLPTVGMPCRSKTPVVGLLRLNAHEHADSVAVLSTAPDLRPSPAPPARCLHAQDKHPDVSVIKVNTEDPAMKSVAEEHVKVLPTFKFFKVRPCASTLSAALAATTRAQGGALRALRRTAWSRRMR